MASVNKVIIGSHAVMANGGIITHTGAHNLAVAAKVGGVLCRISVPFCFCELNATLHRWN